MPRHIEYHFGFTKVQPDAVFLVDVLDDGGVGREYLWRYQKEVYLAERIGLELARIRGSQVPDAVLVHQLVGVYCLNQLGAGGFELFIADDVAFLDGVLELVE